MTQNSKETRERPGWRGIGGVSKKKTDATKAKAASLSQPARKSAAAAGDAKPVNVIPLELQQLLLNIFKDSFPDVLRDENLKPLLQEIKTALYDRDFEKAFGKADFLEAYAVRWSAGRSLGYAECLVSLREYFDRGGGSGKLDGEKSDDQNSIGTPDTIGRVVCLGGGAAEVVAFGGLARHFMGPVKSIAQNSDDLLAEDMKSLALVAPTPTPKTDLILIDSADWSSVIQKLTTSLTTPPPLSKYASTTAKASNAPLLHHDSLKTTFQQIDILNMGKAELEKVLGSEPSLVTLLFTLNELYTSSITKSTTFLLDLTMAAVPGTLLLVVDSPGSYSEASLGKETEKKKYPMQWLMDRTLLEGDEGKGKAKWRKEVGNESQWFRLVEGLKYPISLENMRYQIHLYRRI